MIIHYITSWGENKKGIKLQYSPAGQTKANYVVSCLKELGYEVKVGSFTYAVRGVRRWVKPYTEVSNIGVPIRYCASIPHLTKYGIFLQLFFVGIQLFFHLIFRVRKEDVVIVYHERYYYWPIRIAKLIAQRKIVLEIEEVYTMVSDFSEKDVRKEIVSFRIADGYILINDVIGRYCQLPDSKPQCVLYGIYKYRRSKADGFNDGKVHVVYAGTLSRFKGGAITAAAAAGYLSPSDFHVHILGFGNGEDIAYINSIVEGLSKKGCPVSFDGLKTGNEFDDFMSKCDIGLSTQSAEGLYNLTSFPSKVLSYLSYGLNVVSVKLEVLEASSVNGCLHYYQDSSPQAIAGAIISTVKEGGMIDRETIAKTLDELDVQFRDHLKKIINDLTTEY